MVRLRFGGKLPRLSRSMLSAFASHSCVFLDIQKSVSLTVGVCSIFQYHIAALLHLAVASLDAT